MEGKILGSRYELLEKIGGGGMALVYKAKCKLLNRFVAVKILRSEFINDEEFVKRFRVEAQSAASLSHPNIVSIYDVGHEGDIHYIVMEYVDGVTLKEYITQKGTINWKEAVNIAIQICSAIEHAHKNHIVHRDIKPHNILLTKDGVSKVTDFGIARAVSSSTITMVGSTIGSVHYFSPEQARGGYTDEKSDLYSLGIALYEMVTGDVPFDGESPVVVALKHLQDEPKPPAEVKEGLPKSVNDIIVKAIMKDQAKRYQTAFDMLEDLYKALKEPDSGFVTIGRTEDVDQFPTKRIPVIDNESLNTKDDMSVKQKAKTKKKTDSLTYWLAGFTATIIIAIFGYTTYSIIVPSLGEQFANEFIVKDYKGRNFEEVKQELASSKINAKSDEKFHDTVESGFIIDQKTQPNMPLKAGATIEFEVSKGPELIKMVDVIKRDYRDAETKLKAMGLEVKFVDEYSETVASGWVIRTDPEAGQDVKPSTVVTVYKSIGPEFEDTKVPDLIGKTRAEAQRLLVEAKLKIGNVYPEDGNNYVDKIVRQKPLPYTDAKEDDAVELYFEEVSNRIRYESESINIPKPENYEDIVRVRIEIYRSDSEAMEILMDEEKTKNDFPLSVLIPVPEGGQTRVNVYLNDVITLEFTKYSSGVQ